ncbi:secretory pathway Sec39 [Xylaria sp. CBS 124048]|nr:secretory pathway Sec39 [Xylaria sp. CBS 124048]
MTPSLSPPRVLLLAVHLAINANLQGLTALVAHHPTVLRPELLLRVLLTCLPETLPPSEYVVLIERIESGDLYSESDLSIQFDSSSVEDVTDAEAAKKVRHLRLLPLAWEHAPRDAIQDPVSLFLIRRAHRLDQEAGLLTLLPDLIVPFLQHAPCIRVWMVSTLLPLLRRNYEYYPHEPITQTLESFERLDNKTAVTLLLSQTGVREEDLPHVGRDLRGLIAPWLHSEARWEPSLEKQDSPNDSGADHVSCPAWEHVFEWLTMRAAVSWKVAVKAFDQWDGPSDIDMGGYSTGWLDDEEQKFLERRYARAALAAAYLIPEASLEALAGVNGIISKIMSLLDQDPCPTLQVASSLLPPFSIEPEADRLFSARSASLMRNDLLEESNYLTAPNQTSTRLLHVLTLSAFILTKSGSPCSVRRAGELTFLQDEREQQAEAMKFIRSFGAHGPKNDDKYWIRARNELLWLRDWGAEEALSSPVVPIHGVFGQLKKEFLEVECLKAFLANTRYSLARAIYEESFEKPLSDDILQDTIVAAAMEAYDNATNPHRGRGGLLKCGDIIQALPEALPETHPASNRIEALLKATHGLSEYRLVLKKGEPFTPVILRVHADPVSIIGKVLEQNPKSYTNIQDLLDIGSNVVDAGLVSSDKPGRLNAVPKPSDTHTAIRRRITAMCIDAALMEDDFETAYSYVVNRIASDADTQIADDYSWKAALQAGKYRRTARTMRPTHIGTASGNLDIRHLEQRIECLSTAVRIAPPTTLQEILNVFRKCEEELNTAVKAEEAQEFAWDDKGDSQAMPGVFNSTVPAGVVQNSPRPARHVEEAPMSLFDLSRATMNRAQRNFAALSSLQRSGQSRSNDTEGVSGEASGGEPRVRKRDQLREAAVGTLASGVGWLIGAQPVDRNQE